MNNNKIYLSLILLLSMLVYKIQAQQVFVRGEKLMGSAFEIMVVANNKKQADEYIDLAVKEIERIEKLISSWDPDSQTSKINRMAGIAPVKVDKELLDLIERSIAISKITDGAFDITYASMDRIWRFDGSMKKMPSKEEIKKSIRNVGYQNIVLDRKNHTVFLKKKGMKIGFGAIGKGYAADKTKAMLIKKGVKAGVINASEDMSVWGAKPDGSPWEVAIVNPFNKKHSFGVFPLKNRAVVTSGDYEKFVVFNGIRYAHIINPKTGYPSTGIVSVTVFAPKAELADALATAIFVMGVEVGIDRINQLPGVECLIVDDKGKVHTSNYIHINLLSDKLNK